MNRTTLSFGPPPLKAAWAPATCVTFAFSEWGPPSAHAAPPHAARASETAAAASSPEMLRRIEPPSSTEREMRPSGQYSFGPSVAQPCASVLQAPEAGAHGVARQYARAEGAESNPAATAATPTNREAGDVRNICVEIPYLTRGARAA